MSGSLAECTIKHTYQTLSQYTIYNTIPTETFTKTPLPSSTLNFFSALQLSLNTIYEMYKEPGPSEIHLC